MLQREEKTALYQMFGVGAVTLGLICGALWLRSIFGTSTTVTVPTSTTVPTTANIAWPAYTSETTVTAGAPLPDGVRKSRCHGCGLETSNPPDIGGEILCNSCTAHYDEYNRKFIENYSNGTAFKCEWCNGRAPAGDGICDSCRAEIARQIRNMD